MAHNQLQEVANWHDALIDVMIQQPSLRQYQLAELFNVTPTWISNLIRSDAFRERLNERRDEHFGAISKSVIDKVETLADIGLELLTEKVEIEGQDMSLDALQNVTSMALKSLGFGSKGPSSSPSFTQNNTTIVAGDPASLDRARRLLEETRRRVLDPKVIEAKTEEVVDTEPALPPAA